MRSVLALSRPRRSALFRAVALAAIITAALFALIGAAARQGPGRMEPSSFRGGGGYWLLAKDGGVFAFGDAKFFGPNRNQGNDIAGMAATATGQGYWTVDDDGDVFAYGDAKDYGSRPGPEIDDIVGFAARSQGDGYWMVSRDGAVYAFGAAAYLGSANTLHLSKPIVGMAATPSGQGYWLLAGDGGVFAYGDARFFGSTGGIKLARPIIDFGPSPDGHGYRFVGSDGGVFSYGTAGFFGSTGSVKLNQPIVGFATTATGNGYWLVGQDGGVFAFGDAEFYGSTGGLKLNSPIVAIVATPRVKVAPVAINDSATVAEDGSVTITVEENDTHALPAAVAVETKPAHGTATLSGTRIVYAPHANYNGPDSFTYRLTDTAGHSATGTVTVTVTPVNDAPVATPGSGSTNEDVALDGSLAGTDVDADTLTFATVTDPSHGSVVVNSDGTFTYTPAADYNGSDSFTFTANDGTVDSAPATFEITVDAVNDAPVATAASGATNEDVALGGTLAGTDVDGDPLTFAKASDPGHGSVVVNSDGTFTYTPAADYNGSDSFTFTANDGTVDSAPATFEITVNPVNDPPTISDIGAQVVIENESLTGIAFTASDVDGDGLTVSASSDDQTLVPDGNIVVGLSGTAGTVSVTPAPGQSGTATITVTVDDGNGGTASDTFVLTVDPDLQPLAANDSVNLAGVLTADIHVLDNDSLGNAPVAVSIATVLDPLTEGTATVNPDGSIHLVVSVSALVDFSFDYTITDADGDTSTATVSVTL